MGGEVQAIYAHKDRHNLVKSPKTYRTALQKAIQSKPEQNSSFAMASLYTHTQSPKSYTHTVTLYQHSFFIEV